MKLLLLATIGLIATAFTAKALGDPDKGKRPSDRSGMLPKPRSTGPMSLEQTLAARRSVRDFKATSLSNEDISQLCWAGQGITDKQAGLRTAPSAGALYPIVLYVVLPDAVYLYEPQTHNLTKHVEGDFRKKLQAAAMDQNAVSDASACFVVADVVDRSAQKYGTRAERYCYMEAGHIAQNILLQATALGLAGVPVGAYDDHKCATALKLPKGQRVLYLLPIGHPQS